jgi:hypothetical protein
MATPKFFEVTEPVDGITYYIIPAGTPLFMGDSKATETDPFAHKVNLPVFFGKTVDEVRKYGTPFAFKTKSELRLLALDESMEKIFENAEKDETFIDGEQVKDIIPSILIKNYGYISGNRDSMVEKDEKLTKYICKNYSNYPGYAIDSMATEIGDNFHREIVMCNNEKHPINNYVTFKEMVLISETETLSNEDTLKHLNISQQDADKRKQAKEEAKKSKDEEEDSDEETSIVVKKLSFGDEEGGGKSRKRTKSHKKQMRNKRRKTHKRGKPKKASRKRK